jgi:hypothetical protein
VRSWLNPREVLLDTSFHQVLAYPGHLALPLLGQNVPIALSRCPRNGVHDIEIKKFALGRPSLRTMTGKTVQHVVRPGAVLSCNRLVPGRLMEHHANRSVLLLAIPGRVYPEDGQARRSDPLPRAPGRLAVCYHRQPC